MNVEYSLGPFCNWFLPTCLDIWSSPDGQRVICSYGARSSLCLLSVVERKLIKCYDCLNVFGVNRSLLSVTRFAKEGRNASKAPLLFVGCGDGEAAVVHCFGNKIVRQTKKFENLNLPAKKILSADWLEINGHLIVFYSMHSTVIYWNTSTNEANPLKIANNNENKYGISCIASSGQSGIQKLAIGYMNGDLTVVYVKDIYTLNERFFSGHNDDICGLSFGWTKGQYSEGVLASVSRDGFIKVWDVYRQHNVADMKLDSTKAQHKNWFALTFIPSNILNKLEIMIGSGNGDILVIDIPVKPPDSKIRIHKPTLFMKNKNLSHSSVIFSIAVDPKSMLAFSSSLDHQMIVWDLTERKAIDSFTTFTHGVHDISFSPIDPSRVAIAVGDGIYSLKFDESLNAITQRRIHIQRNSKAKDVMGMSVVWHPECENRLAFGSSNGDITVMDLNSNYKSPKYTNRKSNDWTKVYNLVWGPSLRSSDESTLYSLHQSGKIYVHYITSNIIDNFTDYINDDIKRTEMKWKPDFNHLSVGNDSGTIDVFEYKNHKLKPKLRIEAFVRTILCLRWNSNKDEETSNWLAVTSLNDYCIHVYCLHEYLKPSDDWFEPPLQVITKPKFVLKGGHSERISSMSWSPYDSNRLVSVSYDKTAQIWDVLKESLLISFEGHRGILYCVIWSAFDEDLIFTGGEDNFFHAWRPSKQNEIIRNTDDYWPHLEGQDPQTEEDMKTVSKLLRDCVNKVHCEMALMNGITNGYEEEEDIRRENIIKSKNKSSKKKTNKESKKTLFPLNNEIENSSKSQKIDDIEALIEKMTGNINTEEMNARILLYGNYEDIKKFIKIESLNHTKHGNYEQRDILNLLFDIKFIIEESIKRKETNPSLVSLSMSVSRNHWKESMALLANQLKEPNPELQTYKNYSLELSAIFLISQNRPKEAIDLLVSHQLFREALIVSKAKINSEEETEELMTKWAEHRKVANDIDGAVKCLVGVKKFAEAHDLLHRRNDQLYSHIMCRLRSAIKSIE